MTVDEKNALIKETYDLLIAAEHAHPGSAEIKALHGKLKECFDAYTAENTGIVQPFDGTSK